MKKIIASLFLSPSFLVCQHVQALTSEAIHTAVNGLYSDKFGIRSQSAKTLSSIKNLSESAEVFRVFQAELGCVAKHPRPAKCHDPKFVYNVLLVAGNLAKKDATSPWDFLVHLSRGRSSTDGSFFQAKSDSDAFRENDYYTPLTSDAKRTREELGRFLDENLKNASVMASCNWPLEKITTLSRRKDFRIYQIYTYDRNYSSDSLQPQYRNKDSMAWIYQGERRIACNTASDIIDLGSKGLFGVSIDEGSGDTLRLDIAVFSFPQNKKLCSYTIESGLEEGETVDPAGLSNMKPEKLLPFLFDFGGSACRSKKILGYTFTSNP